MKIIKRLLKRMINSINLYNIRLVGCRHGRNVVISRPFKMKNVSIGRYSYVAPNSQISFADIGSFCSIGPNFLCGWGIHPVNGLSTSPVFYSTGSQSGCTFAKENKIEERKKITIGNDVFIGANVTVLDGIEIGDGAIIGAGAVVTKSIPPYAVAYGCPIKIARFRFSEEMVHELLKIKWWFFDDTNLQDVEKYFYNINDFIEKYK